MKKTIAFVAFILAAVESFSQIIPKVEFDFISTVNGKKYSGILINNTTDSISIQINTKMFVIAKSEIDTIGKRNYDLPFVKSSKYSVVTLLDSSPNKQITGDILEYVYGNTIVFRESKSGKIYNLKWNQFNNLKTMDPDFYYFDIIQPALSGPLKGEFIEVLDGDRFIFIDQNGKKAEYYFSRVDDIYLRHPEKFNIPTKFSKAPKEQVKLNQFFSFGGGLLIPSEISVGNSTSQNGFSNYGFHVYADLNIPVGKYVYWGASAIFQSIPSAIKEKNNYSSEAENWINMWFLTGPMLAFQNDETMSYITIQTGILIPSFPTQTIIYKPTNYTEIISGESNNQIAFAFGGGFIFSKVVLSAKYLTSSADFTIKSSRTTLTGKLETDISTFVFCLGIKLGK